MRDNGAWSVRADESIAHGALTNSKRPSSFIRGVYPTHLVRAKGCHVWDTAGKKYTDFIGANGTNLLGYCDPGITAVAKRQITQGVLLPLSSTVEVEAAEAFKGLSPEMQKVIISTAAIAAAIGPVLLGVGAVLKVVPLVISGYNAIVAAGAFVAANFVAIAAVATVAFLAYKAFSGQTKELSLIEVERNRVNQLGNTIGATALKSIIDRKAQLSQLVAVARDENTGLKERKAAIAEINKISPEYLGNITLENINTVKATDALNKYNAALLRGAKARAAKDALTEFYAKQIKAEQAMAAGLEKEKKAIDAP